MDTPLFKYKWMKDMHPGYVVYRNVFDTGKCTLEEGIKTHKVALFVTESDAKNYCDYRNHMTELYGKDDVTLIDTYDT